MNDLTHDQISNENFLQKAKVYLRETAKWAKFLAILSFITIGLMLLMGLFFGTIMSSIPMGDTPYGDLPSAFFLIYFILIGLLMFFPAFYLYKFATKTLLGIDQASDEAIVEGLANLKSVFKFYGIMTIIVLGLYAIVFIVALIGGGIAAMS